MKIAISILAVFLAIGPSLARSAVLMSEDFQGLPLQPFESATESSGDGTDWTSMLPPGWSVSFFGPQGNPIEFQGWRVLDVDSWVGTELDEGRSTWSRAGIGLHDAVLVADTDAYDDGTDVDPNSFSSIVTTPPIDLRFVASNSVTIEFDSFFRNEPPQQARLDVTFDGGTTFYSILRYDSGVIANGTIIDERPIIALDNPVSGLMFFRFFIFGAGDNGWWAVDDVVINGTVTGGPAPLKVTNKNDSGAGSLRQAISDATNGDTIVFDPTLTGAITLTSGELLLNKSITLNGPGANILSLNGNSSSSVLHIASGSSLIANLGITNGYTTESGGGVVIGGGSLTLSNCTVRGCYAEGIFGGGGLYVGPGNLSLVNCSITENDSPSIGGGVAINLGGSVSMLNSTISGNSASDTILGGNGGGIHLQTGSLGLTNCTVLNNSSASFGGGIYRTVGLVTVRNTIVAANDAPVAPDIFGTVVSGGYNLIGNTNGSIWVGSTGDRLNLDPLVGTLAQNGGRTPTHALLPGSPAIDQGHSSGQSTDQRGGARVINKPTVPNGVGGDAADIGAFEVGGFTAITSITRTLNDMQLNFTTDLGNGYRLQRRDSLSSGVWITLFDNVAGTGSDVTRIDLGAATQSQGFYRIQSLP
jgi:hypothetical protein